MDYSRVGRRLIWLWIFSVFLNVPARAEVSYTILTNNGVVEGLEERGIGVFRGIPYAQPPIGPLRWQPPRPAGAYPKPLQAHAYGPRCMQRTSGDSPPLVSEDCLTPVSYTHLTLPTKA